MTPVDLSRSVVRALRRAVEDGELPVGVVAPERVVVERTRPGGVGDYASPVAFGVAKGAGVAPRAVAEVLASRLAGLPGIERVEITGAGFLNFVLAETSVAEYVRSIRAGAGGVELYGFAAPGTPPSTAEVGGELRECVVRAAVQRIVRSQGVGVGESGAAVRVAPVAKRDGDVRARFGAGAAAWAMLSVPGHETPVFPAWLLVQDESSEFFRVRYALDRARALTRNAGQLGFRGEPGELGEPGEPGESGEVRGADALLAALRDQPLVLEAAAHHRAPERLVRQLVVIADALLDFQYHVLPRGDEKPSAAHRARLALAEAAGAVLAGGLALLGIDAPDDHHL
ncbi:ArgS-related anticodon-binding protein NrtL [Streptomyces sp. NBC_01264]|uniref:ArgS-related anticodon-binding protein NrtL n=1 Tax=Streptomyces sp. NBC_01264 TaxID=2903804 RepID=UPI002259716F|nr:DALR anticodon-binding domain-containing protein [Streptomyces sp. NBC_01264]MCX4781058.1 DALR anticodon-binding domain-containing protein [Streptomyces sp. NBC_01264]